MQNPYDKIAEQWHSNDRGQSYANRVLGFVDAVLEGLLPGARVLDLGCGTGNFIARHIVKRGFHVVGVDQSKKMLEIARNEVPDAEFIHSDMIDVQLAGKFVAAIAWDSIFHIDREHHAGIFQKLVNSLEPGGRLLLSVGGSGDPGFTSEMYGHTFFYSAHEPDIARRLLEESGFEIEVWEVDDPFDRGHIAIVARKVA